MISKKQRVLAGSLTTVLIIVTTVYVWRTHTNSIQSITDPSVIRINAGRSADGAKVIPDGESIIVTGVFGCLANSQTTGVQNMSCALGVIDDSGTQYSLNSDDQMLIGSIPTGQRINVKGVLIGRPSTTQAGIIKVQTIDRL